MLLVDRNFSNHCHRLMDEDKTNNQGCSMYTFISTDKRQTERKANYVRYSSLSSGCKKHTHVLSSISLIHTFYSCFDLTSSEKSVVSLSIEMIFHVINVVRDGFFCWFVIIFLSLLFHFRWSTFHSFCIQSTETTEIEWMKECLGSFFFSCTHMPWYVYLRLFIIESFAW